MTEAAAPDLTPRPVTPARRGGKWVPIAILVAIAAAVVVMVWFLVTNSQSFLEADKAVADRADVGDKRFQLLGSPIADATGDESRIIDGDEFTPFTVAFDGVKVDVLSHGQPPDLFDAGVPVVLEGHWVEADPPAGIAWPDGANDGWYFSTDRILVKHDNVYTAEEQDRLDDAEQRGRLEVTGSG